MDLSRGLGDVYKRQFQHCGAIDAQATAIARSDFA
jgi:hypothetical protein